MACGHCFETHESENAFLDCGNLLLILSKTNFTGNVLKDKFNVCPRNPLTNTEIDFFAFFFRRWGELCGSGCILSNSVDMSKWMLFHLNRKNSAHFDTVLKSDNLEEAHSSQNVVKPSSRCKYYSKPTTPVTLSEATYGMGWRIGHYRGTDLCVS